MQSKRIVFQRCSVACGNRAVKRLWMTEACTVVNLLIVVWCLHAFGPHTTAMAWGHLTANPWLSEVRWKGALFRSPAACSSAEYVCLSPMGTQGLHSLGPSACVCVVIHVYAYLHGGGGLQLQTCLIMTVNRPSVSELAVASCLKLLQVHPSQLSNSKTASFPHFVGSRMEAIDESAVISED